jgi:hypothetical protein
MSVAFERRSRRLASPSELAVMHVREEDRPMKLRVLFRWPALVAAFVLMVMLMPASAVAKKPPRGGGGGGGFSTTSTYVKNYADVLNGVEHGLTSEDVQATADGGWAALAITSTSAGVSWLMKASAVGAPQWQELIGCLNGAPGDYADEVSLQQTSDGGYVLAGGTIGCGSGSECPELTGLQCGLIERLDSAGQIVWARVYSADADGTGFWQIKQTSDGGYVAVGNATDVNHNSGALILKLDSLGNVQWQRQLGPTGTSQAYFYAVQQTADGGFVAAGELNTGTNSSLGLPLISVLAVKFDAAGNVNWQRGFNDIGSTGVTATEHTQAIAQTADGGYAIGGSWGSATTGPGSCCEGALLLKLTASGSIQWQTAYSGGVVCGYLSCTDIGGDVYSLHQTADGSYLLAGDAGPPWLAKVDGNGALVWQEADYQLNPEYGTPLSEYFASSAITATGPLAIGYTENPTSGVGELLGVQTDANGAVGTCSQIHPASTLTATNPGLAPLAPGLTTTTSAVSQGSSPVQVQATTATATASQC